MIRNLAPLLFLVLLVLASSCGKNNSGVATGVMSSQIIVGDLDWQDITSLSETSPIRINAKAVATIDLPVMNSRCTGFMISDDILMTNQHCIPTSSYARGVSARFKHEKGVSVSEQKVYDCSTFIGNDELLDYALLKCTGNPGAIHGKVALSTEEFSVSDALYIVQQNCDYYTDRSCDPTKKFSRGLITEVADEYTHNADTLGGSSGSPVFSQEENTVYAIHHAGLGNNGRGRGVENYAVPMDRIVADIRTRFPQLSINVAGSEGDTPTTPAENTSVSDALALASGDVVDSQISSAGEIRYYKVSLVSSRTVAVTLNFSHRLGDLDLYLMDSSGKVIGKSLGVKDTEKIVKSLASGEYIIYVVGYRGAKTTYSLKLN